MKIVCIYLIFIVAFFGGSLEGYNIVPPVIHWATEPLIYFCLLLALIIHKGVIRLPLLPLIVIFILVGFSSVVINESFKIGSVLSLRNLLRYYVFFIAVINLRLSENQLKNINTFLLFLFVLQIPVATIKLFIYGQGERAIGTYMIHGGTLSTVIPLVAIGFLIGMYFYYGKKNSFLLLIGGFIFFSIIGGKRAFVFFLPVLISFSILFLWKDNYLKKQENTIKRSQIIIYSSLLIIVVGFFALKYVPTLNPEKKAGGTVSVKHAIEYAKKYSTRYKPDAPEYSAGRLAVAKTVFTTMAKEGFDKFIFGFGPGSWTKSRYKSKNTVNKVLLIAYGMTPLTITMVEYGFIGVTVYFFFMVFMFINCLNYWKYEHDPYWKAFSFGAMAFSFTMLMLWFSYGKGTLVGDTIPPVFYYCMALVFIKLNEKQNILMKKSVLT